MTDPAERDEPSGSPTPSGAAAPQSRDEPAGSRPPSGAAAESLEEAPARSSGAAAEGVESGSRRDQWRPVRRTVAQVTIAFTVLFLVPLIRLVLGLDDDGPKVERGPAAWVVWLASLAVMVAAALIAVKALRTGDRATEVRLTWWCGGLWIAGFVLTTIYSSLVN